MRDAPRIETSRLELSVGADADVDTLFPLVHGAAGRAVTDMLLWDGPDHPDELREYLRRHAAGVFGEDGVHWLVRDRLGSLTGERGLPIGAIGVRPHSEEGVGELGYWLAPPYWGQGLMAEAIRAVAEHGFRELGLRAVVADVFSHNERGRRLVEKLGFVEGKLRPRTRVKRGAFVDQIAYRLDAPSASP